MKKVVLLIIAMLATTNIVSNVLCMDCALQKTNDIIRHIAGCTLNKNPLDYYGIVEKILIKENFQINTQSDEDGCTLLHDAVLQNNIQAISALLRHKANINIQNNEGKTPLHVAAEWDHAQAARVLAKNLANMTIKDKHGRTALETAKKCMAHNVEKILNAPAGTL